MSLNAILTGMGSPIEDAARHARSFSDLQTLSDKQVASERARIQYMRNEEARRRQMEAVAGPEDLAGGTPGQMINMSTAPAAAAPTFAGTPVPDIQRAQYIARNVTPAVAPNQSNAESARLSRYAPPAPRPGDPIVGSDWQPGTGQFVALRGPAGEKQRLDYLRGLNPATATGGNESMAEANRINANRVPAAAPTASAPVSAGFDALAQAVKMVESAGDPNAVSSKGAVGTMQTMPGTLRDPGYGVRPAQNNTPAELERVGRDYLQAMIAKYPGNLSHALAAYNWGPGNTDKWIAAGADPAKLPKETRDYIPKVMARLGGQAPQTAAAPAQTPQTAAAPVQTPQPTAAAPTAGIPTQAAAPAQAPAAPDMAFSPEQVTRIATAAQQDLRIKQLQLAEINRQLSYAPDLATATSLRNQANEIRFGAYQAQLVNATAQAVGGDEQAMAQLANAARVQYAQTNQGFVAVAMGQDGQYRATTPPMSRERFINTLYSEATGAAQKARAEQAAAAAKASGDIAVKQQEGVNAIAKVRAEAEAAKQKFILEYGLTQNDVSAIEFDPIRGTPYMRTKGGVFALQPSQEVNGMQTEAKWVPIPS
jgi:soluble lytic murein transglycosylase-like protein